MALEIVSLGKLREHEKIEPVYLERLKKQIQNDGILKRPIVVDKNTRIILDGHFRFNALKQLGCSRIPVFYVDYNSPDILVTAWRDGEIVTKEDVIRAGLNGKKFPPKSSKHMVVLNNKLLHISAMEKYVNISLNHLGKKNESVNRELFIPQAIEKETMTKFNNPIKKIYNITAYDYDRLVTPIRINQFLALMHELNLKGNEIVLEIGNGPGRLAIELSKRLPRGVVIGVDISEKMVELAKRKARSQKLKNVKFLNEDATDLRFKDEIFDVVVNSLVLHWSTDPKKILNEMNRVLKKNGKIGIISTTRNGYREVRRAFKKIREKYFQFYGLPEEIIGLKIPSIKELEKLITSSGFSIEREFIVEYKEHLEVSDYLQRIDAITGEKYFEPLFKRTKEKLKNELIEELLKTNNRMRQTESSFFVIGKKVNGI